MDDTAPAEFLFGRLASDFLKIPKSSNENFIYTGKKKIRFDAVLFFIQSLIFSTIGFSIFLFNETFQSSYFLFLTILGIILLLVTSIKNKMLINRYGPDLILRSQNFGQFALIQVILVNFTFTLLSIGIYITIDQFTDLNSITKINVIGIFIFIIYSKVLSDLGITSIAHGTGLLGSEGGIRRTLNNFVKLTKIKGRYSFQLSIIRLFLVLLIYYFIVELNSILPLILIIAFSSYYLAKWEKINTSSIVMEVRGHIIANKPAVLPNKIIETIMNSETSNNTLSNLLIPSTPNSPSSLSQGIFSNKKKRRFRRKNSSSEKLTNLGPIAAKSISKIADNIKNEEDSLPHNLVGYCNECGAESLLSSNFCPNCGNKT